MKTLIRKEKKEFVEELKKTITATKPRKYLVEDLSKDFHCQEGVIDKISFGKKNGSTVTTNQDKEFHILDADFMDIYKKIRRSAQIISLKDIGMIIAYTGINKTSNVVDAGAGSGALAIFLAHICKKVSTYEIREDFYKVAKANKEKLKMENLVVKHKDIMEGIDEKNVDMISLDLPAPWKAVNVAEKALKVGGYLVNYSPSISQTVDLVNCLQKKDNFVHLNTTEIIKRDWEVKDRKIRPITTQNVHTGFLSYFRKIS